MPKLIDYLGNVGTDISIGTAVIFELPGLISTIRDEIPVVSQEAKALYADILEPAEDIWNDVKVVIQGGGVTTVADNTAKTMTDLATLENSVKKVLALAEADASSEYAKIAPRLTGLASKFGISLPTTVFPNANAAAAAPENAGS